MQNNCLTAINDTWLVDNRNILDDDQLGMSAYIPHSTASLAMTFYTQSHKYISLHKDCTSMTIPAASSSLLGSNPPGFLELGTPPPLLHFTRTAQHSID
jgi:hypothetical protein